MYLEFKPDNLATGQGQVVLKKKKKKKTVWGPTTCIEAAKWLDNVDMFDVLTWL